MSVSVKDALEVASKGFHVFPLANNSKVPLKGSKGLKDATRDFEKIMDMWGDQSFNLGVATEIFGDGEALAAVDIDYKPHEGKDGFRSMHELETHGKKLHETFTQRTPSGGAHFIYKNDKPLKSGTSCLGKNIDLKSAGGYIVLSPSEIAGKKYEITNRKAPTATPEWVKEARPLDRKPPLSLVGEMNAQTAVNQVQAIEFARDFLKRLPVSASGNRNNDAYLAALKLKDLGLTFRNTIDTLWELFKSEPALEGSEIEHVVTSAFKYGKLAPGSRNPGDIFERIEESHGGEILINELEENRKRKIIIERETIVVRPPPELIENLLSERDFSFIYGAPGSGKSFVAINMGLAIAHGLPFLGRRTLKRPVVYVASEAGASVRARRYAWESHFGMSGGDFGLIASQLDLRDKKGDRTELVERVLETGWRDGLLFVDTMNRSLGGGDENDNRDVGHFMYNVGEITRLTGFGVCVIHHVGKDQTKGLRGHSSLLGNADTVLEVVGGRIAARKQKDREIGMSIAFSLKPVSVESEVGTIQSCVIESGAPGGDGFPSFRDEETVKARESLLMLEMTLDIVRLIDVKREFWRRTGNDTRDKKTRSWARVHEKHAFEGFQIDEEGVILRV